MLKYIKWHTSLIYDLHNKFIATNHDGCKCFFIKNVHNPDEYGTGSSANDLLDNPCVRLMFRALWESICPHFGRTFHTLETKIPDKKLLYTTRHVFVKHGCPRQQQSQNMAKSLSPTFWPRPTPQGHGMSMKNEEAIDELTVQVWLLYDHPNFKYCTLFVSGTEIRINGQTDRRTDRRRDGRSKH